MPEGEGPKEVSLVRKVPGAGYTFILAGVLKIMTIGWIATSAPVECVRTTAGQWSQFLLIPIGLLLAFVAKKVVDTGLNENKRFMMFLMGAIVLLYFGLPSLLYRYEPKTYRDYQRLVAAAQHSREVDLRDVDPRRKFIIQRQLEGEFDTVRRNPEAMLQDADARIPEGVLQGPDAPSASYQDLSRDGGARGGNGLPRYGVMPTTRGARAVREVPSMYQKVSTIPGLDDSD